MPYLGCMEIIKFFLLFNNFLNTVYIDQMCLHSEIIGLAEGFIRHFHEPQMVEFENETIYYTFH